MLGATLFRDKGALKERNKDARTKRQSDIKEVYVGKKERGKGLMSVKNLPG